jgi:uncharacterized membrane protein HdeD (DUF308 family)
MSGGRSILGGVVAGTHYVGWALVVLGLVAALAPVATGATVVVVIGLVLLAAGVLIGWWGLRAREAGKGSTGLVMAALAAVAGLVLVVQPTAGLSLVRLLLVGYFLLSGIAEIATAWQLRATDDDWTSMLGSGVVSILAGAALWADWPISGARAIGIFVGVKLASVGGAVVRLSRRLDAAGDRVAAARTRLASRRRQD